MKNQTDNQNPIERKRALLSALLSKEIAPNEFKERVKENGLPTRILSLKEEWQSDLEFYGGSTEVHIGNGKYTFREVLDHFDEFEAKIAEQKILGGMVGVIVSFPLDPDSISSKLFDNNLSYEEHQQIIKAYCERWGKPYPDMGFPAGQ